LVGDEPAMREWAAELVDRARHDGVELTGDDGLLTALVRQVLQTGLEVEMTDHLGYERHAVEGRNTGNSRNGSYPKTVTTEVGQVRLEVPRDRNASFEPATIPKGQRRLDGLSGNVISLYAKGMTTGDIQAHLAELYDTSISKDTISRITDAVLEDMQIWQQRPLDRVYPVILIDAIVVKIRDGQVANRPIYVAIGINLDGERDVLGLWVGILRCGTWAEVSRRRRRRHSDYACGYRAGQQLATASSASQVCRHPVQPSWPSRVVSTDLGTAARLSKVARLS
jgi:transposase-like protein